MEILDTEEGKAAGIAAASQEKHGSIDQFVKTRVFEEREEEEKVEAAMALYVRAARARMPSAAPVPPESGKSEEELEAISQELKLRQKCQDIAAQILVDELEEEFDSEE